MKGNVPWSYQRFVQLLHVAARYDDKDDLLIGIGPSGTTRSSGTTTTTGSTTRGSISSVYVGFRSDAIQFIQKRRQNAIANVAPRCRRSFVRSSVSSTMRCHELDQHKHKHTHSFTNTRVPAMCQRVKIVKIQYTRRRTARSLENRSNSGFRIPEILRQEIRAGHFDEVHVHLGREQDQVSDGAPWSVFTYSRVAYLFRHDTHEVTLPTPTRTIHHHAFAAFRTH